MPINASVASAVSTAKRCNPGWFVERDMNNNFRNPSLKTNRCECNHPQRFETFSLLDFEHEVLLRFAVLHFNFLVRAFLRPGLAMQRGDRVFAGRDVLDRVLAVL